MVKKIAAAGLILSLSFCVAAAAPAATPSTASAPKTSALDVSVTTWLTHLKEALTQSTLSADYQKGDLAQVAAVRGAKQDSDAANPDKPVWKGGFADEGTTQLKKERAALAQGVSLILQGQVKEGRTQITAFEKQYPESSLRGYAQKALEKTALVLPAPKAATTSAPAASAPAGSSSR